MGIKKISEVSLTDNISNDDSVIGVFDGTLKRAKVQDLIADKSNNKLEQLTLDTIDTFYEEEVCSPYIELTEPALHNFSYDMYEISSHEDLVRAYKYMKKNTDLLRYEFDEIHVTAGGEKKTIVSGKTVCYESILADSPKTNTNAFNGEKLHNLINAFETEAEMPDHYFVTMSGGYGMFCISMKSGVEYIYGAGVMENDGRISALYVTAENEYTEYLGADKVEIISDIEIKGRVYAEHYGDAVKYLFENGYYENVYYQSGQPVINKEPFLFLSLVNSYEDAYNASGYPIYSYLTVDNRYMLKFLNDFYPNDLTQDVRMCCVPQFSVTGPDVTYDDLQDTLLGNIASTSCTENPDYKPFIGWEKVYESLFENVDYTVKPEDYGKYDYMLVTHPTLDGFFPSGSVEITIKKSDCKDEIYDYGPYSSSKFPVRLLITSDQWALSFAKEHFYIAPGGTYIESLEKRKTSPDYRYIKSIGNPHCNTYGCRLKIYRKRCC